MAIRVALEHETTYEYDRYVSLSPQVVRLKPSAHCRTKVESFSLSVEPALHFINWQQDPFGNYLARLVFPEAVKVFTVKVELVCELVTVNPFDFFLEPEATHFPFGYEASLGKELAPFLEVAETGTQFEALAQKLWGQFASAHQRVVDVLVAINQHINRTLRYDIRMEPGVFAPEETLTRGHGSCRDFAWLLVNLLRRLGIAARFVSGYSIQLVADQKPLEGPVGVDSDCTDLHAWAEAYLPGAGWVGLDATSGLFCGEGHIPLACTTAPSSAAPVTGAFEFTPRFEGDEAKCKFAVTMRVLRLQERPRPTRSYTEQQWDAIVECGNRVESVLALNHARLTMGGEPTFVSIDDMDGAEWNTAAIGPTKAAISDRLIRRLRDRFAPHGVIIHGQGKWYPGEQLPRFAYSLCFRKDREPVWRDGSLIADGTPLGHDASLANRFVARLAESLGVDPCCARPAFEDTLYYLWRERRLPSNVDPFDSKLDDEQERARLRRVFEVGLAETVGFALPLRVDVDASGGRGWKTGHWLLRDERLYLLPGDSPMGYRLPLDSLPWEIERELPSDLPMDPFAVAPSLKNHRELVAIQRQAQGGSGQGEPSQRSVTSADVIRSALCVEPRGGILHVFLPPIGHAEAYLELIAKLEEVARCLNAPIRLEGYLPPYHPNLERISVTPDPGVIEVNVHPARNWTDCVNNTVAFYDEARLARLGTEKFLMDGRHAGTGGGNHIVLGGETPADSPFLRRPDLLTSFVAFFNNHPALSYVFSGLFVGPTSQAPRIDEARNDSLYELEIARQILESAGANAPPWLVDRALRHLLVDLTGNTHRAEFCIDKLYSPDSVTGRLGLLELRAFEMPPDARMSCSQQLLVRAMVAKFLEQPYRRKLVRWGTALHDRFALPYFLWEDLTSAVMELSHPSYEIDPVWFLPHWEFRFPRLGQFDATGGIRVELRQAIEPWHVLGEEQFAGGTSRYVDSSVERIQIQVDGMTDSRYALSIAGRGVPLTCTGRAGQFVAGVRYKAWKPPSSLHPTLDVDSPLVVALYDTWNQICVGAATYFVSHPGGRAYDCSPSNGLEAESRRMARFAKIGKPQGQFELTPIARSLEHPMTLDLRCPRY